MPDGTITPSQVEKRWGISQKVQMRARERGEFCPWITINGRVYYRLETFVRWLDERESTTPQEKVASE